MTSVDMDLMDELRNGSLGLLLAEPPVAFHRIFTGITGSTTAALLLSVVLEHLDQAQATNEVDQHGWTLVSPEQIEVRSGLTRKEQQTARKVLRTIGLLEEQRDGYPARLQMRLNYQRLSQLLVSDARRKAAERTHWMSPTQH